MNDGLEQEVGMPLRSEQQNGSSLESRLKPIFRRVRLLLAERCALLGGVLALIVCLLLLTADKLRWIRADWEYLAGLLALGLIVVHRAYFSAKRRIRIAPLRRDETQNDFPRVR